MGVNLVTGYGGQGHISSADAGLFNAGICGRGKYVLDTNETFAYELTGNSTIKIKSGDLVDQGRHITLPYGEEVSLNIANGTQNRTRMDVVAMRYNKDSVTGIESASLVILTGDTVPTGSTPLPAAITQGDIFAGDMVDDVPLYHITVTDLQVTDVTPVFTVIHGIGSIGLSIYPVGAIYISTTSTNPSVLFGGTWEEIEGKFLLGRSASHEAGTTGGEETHQLTASEMPAHTHTGPSHTHSGPSHTHTGPSHTPTINSHTHTGSTASAGNHHHHVNRSKVAASGTARYAIQPAASKPDDTYESTQQTGAHTHTVTINGSGVLTTNASGTGQTGASGTGQTGASGTGLTGSAGGNAAHNNMPPFLTVYMWKRTA